MRLILKIRMGKMLPQTDFKCHMIVGFMQSVFNICKTAHLCLTCIHKAGALFVLFLMHIGGNVIVIFSSVF